MEMNGRSLRIDMKKRVSERPERAEPRDWGESSSKGINPSEKTGRSMVKERSAVRTQNEKPTVYIGGLAYAVSQNNIISIIIAQWLTEYFRS